MTSQSTTAYEAEMATWQAKRLQDLKKTDGYLSLVGLCWLSLGENSFGSATNHPCPFPAGMPANIGRYQVTDSGITVHIEPDVPVTHKGQPVSSMPILTDIDSGGPTVLELGSVSWFVIKRGAALGIRIRDSKSDLLSKFNGVDSFPRDEAWRIKAAFKKYDEPRTVPIPTILGTDAAMVSPGTLDITINGESREMIALKAADADRLFLIVADGLAGKETYGGGRFLITEPVDAQGNVVVDFNKATNPPCAFTPWATCPRPPDENRFAVEIPAGEKVFK
ncbi:MAG: DUF1684 domain-containing protein [Anaerolineae bacterium]